MISPPIPENERERLEAIYSYGILDTAEESDFDEIVKLASHVCGTPMSLITLIDKDRQWFKAKIGLEGSETSREEAICAHAIHQDDLMTVNDARLDPRFVDNPFVTGSPDIRFHAGMPLTTPSGFKLGTLCVIDCVVISVSDQGIGISQHSISDLFSWSTRTTTLGSADERGSGLGLPKCQEFARAHGGEITVESTIGEGSTFHIRLPKT